MLQNTRPTPFAEQLVGLLRLAIATDDGAHVSPISHILPIRPRANLPPTICTVDLTPNDKGMFMVTCRELPEVLTYGTDEEEALEMAELSIEGALWVRRRSAGFPCRSPCFIDRLPSPHRLTFPRPR